MSRRTVTDSTSLRRTLGRGCLLVCLLGVWSTPLPAADSTIKKCQDAQGRWHYGDTAAAECASTGVTEISTEGYKVKEQAAPKTADELRAEEQARAAAEAERLAREQQRKADQHILTVYETEENLIRSRDERIAHINSTIQLNNELIKKLSINHERLQGRLAQTQDAKAREGLEKEIAQIAAQIAQYDANNTQQLEELERVRARYDADLERFRAARGAAPADPPAAAPDSQKKPD